MKFVTQNYYEIMGVAPGASNEEVKRAYRTVRQSFRPDSMAIHSLYSAEETEAISTKIDEAFRILSDPESARRYEKYHRTGLAGMRVPRDPDEFFDLVHDLDANSPMESLAREVGRLHPTPAEAPAAGEEKGTPLQLTERLTDVKQRSLRAVAEAEVFIDSLEVVSLDSDRLSAPAAAPAASQAPAASVQEEAPAMIRTPSGPHLARSRMSDPHIPRVEGLHRARPEAVQAPPAEVAPTASPTARAQSTAPAPGAAVTSPGTRASSAGAWTSPGSPRADLGSPAPKVEAQGRSWQRDTVRTRAVGELAVEPLPREELEAIEMDCGGICGTYLQQVRRELDISLEDIASRTKIGLSALRYIEADDISNLPAKVYLKGYLSQICRLLRLPVPETPGRYLQYHGI